MKMQCALSSMASGYAVADGQELMSTIPTHANNNDSNRLINQSGNTSLPINNRHGRQRDQVSQLRILTRLMLNADKSDDIAQSPRLKQSQELPMPLASNSKSIQKYTLSNMPAEIKVLIASQLDRDSIKILRQVSGAFDWAASSVVKRVCVSNRDDLECALKVYAGGGLDRLTLKGNDFTDHDLINLPSSLKELDLSGNLNITDAGLKNLHNLTRLAVLKLSDCKQFTDASIDSIPVTLQKLSLQNWDGLSDLGLEKLSSRSQLKHLSLQGCTNITQDGLSHLKKLPDLRTLDLSLCPGLNNAWLNQIKQIKQLLCLLLYCSEQVTDEGLVNFEMLKHLKILGIKQCPNVSDDAINGLRQKNQTLRILQ